MEGGDTLTLRTKHMGDRRLYDLFLSQLSSVMDVVTDAEQDTVKLLTEPMQEIIVHFPCVVGDQVQLFKGYRVQHNNSLGPFKGGLRFHPDVYLDECKALAGFMTVKTALHRLPLGGAKGCLKIDPQKYATADLHNISRAFCRALRPHIGTLVDIPAPDVGTDAGVMDVMVSELNRGQPRRDVAAFTGKSIECGGSEGRAAATGRGVMICVREWGKRSGIDLRGKTFAVQGMGKVGSHATHLLVSELGMVCVAVGDHSAHLVCEEGFNVHRLIEHVASTRCVSGYPNGTPVDRAAFFATACDVFVPAALELQVTEAEAKTMRCAVVFEAANGPTDVAGEATLLSRGIQVFPDVLVNAGGVIVSFYEYVQNKRDEHWSEQEVNRRMDEAMTQTLTHVLQATDDTVTLRQRCFAQAVSRIHHVATLYT